MDRLFGYVHEPPRRCPELGAMLVGAPPPAHDSGYRSPVLYQRFSDCVERTIAKAMLRRMVAQRSKRDVVPKLPSSRWMYWQWLESIGKLGDATQGTQPYVFLDLLEKRGWCAEEHMPYSLEEYEPGIGIDDAPSIAAIRHAHDQRGKLRGHAAEGLNEIKLALVHGLGVGLAIACDRRFVAMDGIPADDAFVWNFDPSSTIVGWHMIEAESYDERGVRCLNTWPNFGDAGRVRIGWETLDSVDYSMPAIIIDYAPVTSDER